MLFDLSDRCSSPVTVPRCQSDFFKDSRKFVNSEVPDGRECPTFLITALVNGFHEVVVYRVEVNTLCKINLSAGKA
jgi:hypothetical protein